MAKSKIEWTDEVWNPLRGCSRVTSECINCYAERYAARFSGPGQPYEGLARFTPKGPRWTGKVRLVEEALEIPLRWKRPRNVFVNSMSDLFHEHVPDRFIMEVFCVMAVAQRHRFVILTKRAERMYDWFGTGAARETQAYAEHSVGVEWPLENVLLGVSAGTQDSVDDLVPYLLASPAAIRVLSLEPLLEEVDLCLVKCPLLDGIQHEPPRGCILCGDDEEICGSGYFNALREGIHWVIAGAESGPASKIRPMEEGWIRQIRNQCRDHSVPFFYKQKIENGKKVSLPVLDGKQHAEHPI